VLVFTASKTNADKVFEYLEPVLGEKVDTIHSNKSQNYRFRAVHAFRNSELKVLIATDLIARGIDVSDVSHVINFDLPEDSETYLHRIGRTGRYDKQGNALSLIKPDEKERFDEFMIALKTKVPYADLPEEVEISDEVLDFEKPKVHMKESHGKLKKLNTADAPGPAFHEKKAKNKKVNIRYNHKKAMQDKYGKPKTKRGKH
jgi:ATP-dependent RNA helicase RhlE